MLQILMEADVEGLIGAARQERTGDRLNLAQRLSPANVLYEKKNGIAYVNLNRPKVLNALNTPTWTDLRTAFEDAETRHRSAGRNPDRRR